MTQAKLTKAAKTALAWIYVTGWRRPNVKSGTRGQLHSFYECDRSSVSRCWKLTPEGAALVEGHPMVRAYRALVATGWNLDRRRYGRRERSRYIYLTKAGVSRSLSATLFTDGYVSADSETQGA